MIYANFPRNKTEPTLPHLQGQSSLLIHRFNVTSIQIRLMTLPYLLDILGKNQYHLTRWLIGFGAIASIPRNWHQSWSHATLYLWLTIDYSGTRIRYPTNQGLEKKMVIGISSRFREFWKHVYTWSLRNVWRPLHILSRICRYIYSYTDGDNDTIFGIYLAQMSWFHECSILLAH